ncbi:helix-turn-helix domain-containing protein [Dactylosporangium sp. NPDC005572]|uniref:helix-turn-helix domain-containing protein n=1 Tax=Dactylosporangium sp. NPDC005572 TaxID=3156889 RepID=UPI0033AA9387
MRDARRLSPQAQEDLRRRVVVAVKAGMRQAAAAKAFQVTPKTVWRWVDAFDREGGP